MSHKIRSGFARPCLSHGVSALADCSNQHKTPFPCRRFVLRILGIPATHAANAFRNQVPQTKTPKPEIQHLPYTLEHKHKVLLSSGTLFEFLAIQRTKLRTLGLEFGLPFWVQGVVPLCR